MTFTLNPQLAADTLPVVEIALSTVRLMNDSRFPWLILVPRRDGATELFDLTPQDQAALMAETTRAARLLRDLTGAAKMNVAAIGNRVPQLHIHVVARFVDDAAWPGPVWGVGVATRYSTAEAAAMVARLASALVSS